MRRIYISESLAIFEYILGEFPSVYSVRGLVRAIESMSNPRPLGLHKCFFKFPLLLNLLDGDYKYFAVNSSCFRWRLDAATLLAESSRMGAQKFLIYKESNGRIFCIFTLFYLVLVDLMWKFACFFVSIFFDFLVLFRFPTKEQRN